MHLIAQSTIDPKPIDWTGMSQRYMNKGELEIIIALMRNVKPRAVLEFGVNAGRTAKAIMANVPGIVSYTGVDVPIGYVTECKVQRNEIPMAPGHLVEQDPRFQLLLPAGGSQQLTADDLSPCDAVFIDGDHGRRGVEHDTALAFAVLRPGGIVIWHDYHDLGTVDVREVLNERDAAGAAMYHVEDTWLVYERKAPDAP